MGALSSEYLTTRELAELLRIKERKVYDLASSGAVPCSRATGKLLFPRAAVDAWLAGRRAGPATGKDVSVRPNVVLGSHDPLLDWALRESRSGLAALFDGSTDGLDRFTGGEGIAAGLHLPDASPAGWNVGAVRARFARAPVVLIEFAWRDRGLVVRREEADAFSDLTALKGRSVAARQAGSGSQVLLERQLEDAGVALREVIFAGPVRTELDAALAVADGKADAAFGLREAARQFRLGFVPLVRERFNLLVDRRAWFEPPVQTFLAFCGSAAFAARAAELEGYRAGGFGRVHFNGA